MRSFKSLKRQTPPIPVFGLYRLYSSTTKLFDMSRAMLGHKDFSVIVQRRAPSPKPWRWEIYRLGRKSPIEFSKVFFETITEASRAGERALALLLSECSD